MVSQGNDSELVASDIVDDAVWEPTQGHPASLPPLCAKLRVIDEESESPFELGDEGKTKLGAAFSRIEERSFG